MRSVAAHASLSGLSYHERIQLATPAIRPVMNRRPQTADYSFDTETV